VTFVGHAVRRPNTDEPSPLVELERYGFDTRVALTQQRLLRAALRAGLASGQGEAPETDVERMAALLGAPERLMRLETTEPSITRVAIQMEDEQMDQRINRFSLTELVPGESAPRAHGRPLPLRRTSTGGEPAQLGLGQGCSSFTQNQVSAPPDSRLASNSRWVSRRTAL
jgi:hypothetical protein